MFSKNACGAVLSYRGILHVRKDRKGHALVWDHAGGVDRSDFSEFRADAARGGPVRLEKAKTERRERPDPAVARSTAAESDIDMFFAEGDRLAQQFPGAERGGDHGIALVIPEQGESRRLTHGDDGGIPAHPETGFSLAEEGIFHRLFDKITAHGGHDGFERSVPAVCDGQGDQRESEAALSVDFFCDLMDLLTRERSLEAV